MDSSFRFASFRMVGRLIEKIHHSSFIIHHSSFIIHHSSFITFKLPQQFSDEFYLK
ncbi:hypothetical protein ACFP3I_01375 [Chryseobacterium arachidis]|uniref:hypothetical protein n=1 Tax=Chryseobacterium arachidis TaxID=1416778 RepID=UPI003617AFAC